MKNWKEFFRAAVIRGIRTFAECMLTYIGTAALLSDVNWIAALSAGAMGFIISILLAIVTGLPEVSDHE